MKKIKLQFEKNYVIEVNSGINCHEVVKNYSLEKDIPVVLARVNGKLCELSSIIEEDSTFSIVDIKDKFGMMTYIRTLQFVLIKSTLELFKDAQITIGHSLSKGLFGEIYKKSKLDIDDIYLIKEKMKEIIEKDIKINKKCFQKEEAIKIFKNYGMDDKVRLLSSIDLEKVNLYELDGQYDYFYESLI